MVANRRILVTGTAGKLGADLVRTWAGRYDLVQLTLETPEDPIVRDEGRLVIGSVADPAIVEEAIDGIDTIVHCAAIPGPRLPYRDITESNVLGTHTLLEAAGERAHVERFIYLSSLCWHGLHFSPRGLYAPDVVPFNEDHRSRADNAYALSKVQAEQWCRQYTIQYGKPVVALRPGWICRLHQEPQHQAIEPSDRPRLMDYVGTSDVIDAIERAMDYDPPDGFEAFLLHALDQRSTMPSIDYAQRWFPDARLDREALAQHDGFAAFVDCTRAHEKLGWHPKHRVIRNAPHEAGT